MMSAPYQLAKRLRPSITDEDLDTIAYPMILTASDNIDAQNTIMRRNNVTPVDEW